MPHLFLCATWNLLVLCHLAPHARWMWILIPFALRQSQSDMVDATLPATRPALQPHTDSACQHSSFLHTCRPLNIKHSHDCYCLSTEPRLDKSYNLCIFGSGRRCREVCHDRYHLRLHYLMNQALSSPAKIYDLANAEMRVEKVSQSVVHQRRWLV